VTSLEGFIKLQAEAEPGQQAVTFVMRAQALGGMTVTERLREMERRHRQTKPSTWRKGYAWRKLKGAERQLWEAPQWSTADLVKVFSDNGRCYYRGHCTEDNIGDAGALDKRQGETEACILPVTCSVRARVAHQGMHLHCLRSQVPMLETGKKASAPFLYNIYLLRAGGVGPVVQADHLSDGGCAAARRERAGAGG
jgi:hypothetical protein